MKFVVFGLSVSSAWGNGHATLWRGLLRALAELGHAAVFFERDTPYYAAHRDLTRGPGYEVVIYPTWDRVAPRAQHELATADAAIVTSYQGDAPEACALVLESRAVRIFYDLDAPVTLACLERGEPVPYLPSRGLGDFDLVLSFTGGPVLEALRDRLGARRVAALYGSVDLEAHRAVSEPSATYACDLSYLATYARDRQPAVERLFLDVAARQPGHCFLLGGPMYPDEMRRPPNVRWLPHVPPPEHSAFYGSSRLTLNLTRAAMARFGHCPSARLFEAAACGAPLVSDAWEGLDRFFEPEREILVARTTDDVRRALALSDGAVAELARRARRRTAAHHTARHRAVELVSLVSA
jgi:spore maturation protein CgeB